MSSNAPKTPFGGGTSPDTKRRLLYNKRIGPNTFVFFFHNGLSETSWSVRDYSIPGTVGLRYASDFQDAAGRIPPGRRDLDRRHL